MKTIYEDVSYQMGDRIRPLANLGILKSAIRHMADITQNMRDVEIRSCNIHISCESNTRKVHLRMTVTQKS